MQPKVISEFEKDDIVFNHYRYENADLNDFSPHTHDALEIVYLKSGDATYAVEDKNYRVGGGNLILTRAGLVHNMLFNSKEVYDRYCIVFNKSILESEIYKKIPKELNVISVGQNTAFEEIFRKADYYLEYLSKEDYYTVLKHLTEEILCNIMLQSGEAEIFTSHPIVSNAIDYVKKNLNCDVGGICRELHITKSYLHQLFIKHLGVSPKGYIMSKRLEKARREMQDGKAPTDIYRECGFNDYCTFYRNYKKYFNCLPSQEPEGKIVELIKT